MDEVELFKARFLIISPVIITTHAVTGQFSRPYCNMTWVCSRFNMCSDWLILGQYSPIMPTGRLRACKSQAKSNIINNLLTSIVRSLRENLKPRPCRIDLAIAWSICMGRRHHQKYKQYKQSSINRNGLNVLC